MISSHQAQRIFRFGIVGGVGFVVDAAIVTALIHSGLDPFSSRAISMGAATLVTWRLNRSFTFKPSQSSQASEGVRYAFVAGCAALANYLVYAALVMSSIHMIPAVAVAVASAVSMWISYFGYGHIAFRRKAVRPDRGGTTEMPYTGVEELDILANAKNYNRSLSEFVAAPMQPGDRVLDFGAGIGSFSRPLRGEVASLTCLEPDERLSRRLESEGFEVARSADEVADASVDYAFTLNVLEHIEDDKTAMADLYRMIKPGGRLAVYVPAFDFLYSNMDKKVGHWRRYGRRELVEKLRDAGFYVEKVRFADSLGVPATMAFKLVDNGSGDVSEKSITIYDRLIFPFSRALDVIAGRFFGKNLAVYAVRPN
ncbi:GtrA family protein [Henriciella litoralis]|uniref:GtrA family protein n=1 Tax=Henriciella litoralis TaxID=568102 RepID=UPI00146B9BD3|nr:GtrA family protein [Henriciella litoralis]